MELAEIAASVAKALELGPLTGIYPEWNEYAGTGWQVQHSMDYLLADGSNLFDPFWQVRCRDWLLERGSVYYKLSKRFQDGVVTHAFFPENSGGACLDFQCPAAEFPARAIHHLAASAQSDR